MNRYKAIKINGKKYDVHRIIMNATSLGYDIIVHHKDGNKLNNDPQNLEIMRRSEHCKKHGFGTLIRPNKIFEMDENGNATCRSCGRIFPWDLFPNNKTWSNGKISICKECKNKKKKEWRMSKIASNIGTVHSTVTE